VKSWEAAPEEMGLEVTANDGSDDADVTCCERPFQIRGPMTLKAWSLTCHVCHVSVTAMNGRQSATKRQNTDGIEPRCLLDGSVHWRGLRTLTDKESQLVVDPLHCLQLM